MLFLDKNTNKNNTNTNEESQTKIIKNDLFTAQIKRGPYKRIRKLQEKNQENQEEDYTNLAQANSTECENLLKKHYNISSKYLIIKKSQFDSKVNLNNLNDTTASDALKIEYFNPENGEKLNSKLCFNITMPISLPIKNIQRLNMELYKESKEKLIGVDIFDKESPSFKSRCFKSTNFITGGDTSITFRKTKLYQNQSMECSIGCEYSGIDEYNTTLCECKIENNEEISNNNTLFDSFLEFPKFNYDIIYCFTETIEDVKLNKIYNIILYYIKKNSYIIYDIYIYIKYLYN
jgi:hypothetical protein